MITRFDHIVLTVRDIERSVEFFVRVLGMEAVTFGAGRRALKFGDQKINLQTLGQETRNFAGIGSGDVCFVTEMATDDLLAHLARVGVPVVEGPVAKTGALGSITSVYIVDPDGNLLEIARYD